MQEPGAGEPNSPTGMDVETYVALGLDQRAPDSVNGRSNSDIIDAINHPGDAPYNPCPEAHPVDGVEAGRVTKFADWQDSAIYPGTVRDLWLYQPPVTGDQAGLLVCNDGAGYLARGGPVRATHVLDNLIHAGDIPPLAAVFVNPGRPVDWEPENTGATYNPASRQRSFEYDSVTPLYGRFLLEEVLPFVARETGAAFSEDPALRIACGISSGGICAFNAAWHFPDSFGRVISHCGSFTNIRGGHNYPYLVRSTPRKPLRVFLQSGANDGATLFGDWPLANQTMANALEYAGYDYRFEFGSGGHSLRHGGAMFADTLRWLLAPTA